MKLEEYIEALEDHKKIVSGTEWRRYNLLFSFSRYATAVAWSSLGIKLLYFGTYGKHNLKIKFTLGIAYYYLTEPLILLSQTFPLLASNYFKFPILPKESSKLLLDIDKDFEGFDSLDQEKNLKNPENAWILPLELAKEK